MRAYIEVRQEGEALIAASGLNATVLRPWYVIGPGHWWPVVLVPVYAFLQRVPSTAGAAKRLGLVTRSQMVDALVSAVEQPATGVRILDVPAIRSAHA
jgi:uncharacterized protein YbjT (DUF2867 family)